MKNLLFAIFSLFLVGLFSVSAFAADSSIQQQNTAIVPAPAPAPQGQRHYYQVTYRYAVPVQWVTHVTQRVDVPYSQNTQQTTSGTGIAQDLKQFSDQTQKQMSDFSKL